jgi:hypothetical protein
MQGFARGCFVSFFSSGEAGSGHLRRYTSLKEGWLFLRSRALHLTVSRLADGAKLGESGY